MSDNPVIVWFRQDLRLTDNVALAKACASGKTVIALYVLDDESPGDWPHGGASRWWLHHSLKRLGETIKAAGGRLLLRRGKAVVEVAALADEAGADEIYFTRMYEPWARTVENELKDKFSEAHVSLRRFGGNLLREPEEVATQSGDPYKVYSPFWRALVKLGAPRKPVAKPRKINWFEGDISSDDLDDWGLLPTKPDWAGGMADEWTPGEAGARDRLTEFLDGPVRGYKSDRNRPDLVGTSRLSPHLHFGEISPSTVWWTASAQGQEKPKGDADRETFLKELVWREFSAHLLFHFSTLPDEPFRPEFAAYPWRDDADGLRAWQKGRTGYPIVDAGMRELWTTGWMHNRVRMVVASFLIKHLLIHWKHGEEWFWDTLVDADLANNAASWQWVAGSGADAAPYFRIFNPITQGKKFDPDGVYVRRWVPEIADLPNDVLHAPWEADPITLQSAGVKLGETYPLPIVDHSAARERALAGYERVKKSKD